MSDRDMRGAVTCGSGNGGAPVDSPGFDAKAVLPEPFRERDADLDDIGKAPGSNVRALEVAGHDSGRGRAGPVTIGFTSIQASTALVDYHRRSATAARHDAVDAALAEMTVAKHERHFALAVAAQGGGSCGTITVTGRN